MVADGLWRFARGRNKEMVRKLGAHEVSRSDLYAGVVMLGFGGGYIALVR